MGSSTRLPGLLSWLTRVDWGPQRLTRGRLSVVDFSGLPNLTLVVPGRTSGVLRRVPLIGMEDRGEYLVVGSYAGSETDPQWVVNLRAADRVAVAVRGRERACTWRELSGDERADRWSVLTREYPNFDVYAARTARRIPVFAVRPIG